MEKEKNIEKIVESIDKLKKFFEEKKMFFDKELIDYLLTTCKLILDEVIDSVSITLCSVKIKISLNSKGIIVINSTFGSSFKVEVV